MATSKDNFIQKIVNAKTGAERGLQAVGGQIRKNVQQGQDNLMSGRAKYYGSINPLKGTLTAFKNGTPS